MKEGTAVAICPGCGARAKPESPICDLCGSEIGLATETGPLPEPVEATGDPSETGVVCPACGRNNRPGAVFCDQCATPIGSSEPKLAVAAVGRPKPKKKAGKPKDKTKKPKQSGSKGGNAGHTNGKAGTKPRVGLLVGGGIVAVLAMYALTVLSKDSEPPPTEAVVAESPAPAGYLPEDRTLASQSDALKSAISSSDDAGMRGDLLRQLVDLYVQNGRLDLAGREQVTIAETDNTAEAWTLAGNLHFDWMERQSGPERVKSSQRAAAAYKRSLELEPGNLDVRTDLGVAYLNDPASPMFAVQETNAVLEADSNHVQANFNKGIMMLQIGRNDEAIQRFEKVMNLTEVGSPAHERASEILTQVTAQ